MKFSVLFLLTFVLVAYSSSQRLDENNNPYWINPLPWRFSPKFYYPIYFDVPREAHQKNYIAIDQDNYYYYNDKVVPQLPLSYRISAQVRDEGQSDETFFNTEFQRPWPAQQRLLFNLFNPNGGSSGLFGPFLSNLVLSTSISTIFSTVTTAVVVLCFPSSRLTPNPPVPCPEKRRLPSEDFEFDLTEAAAETAPYLLPLVPSTVEKIEPTVKPTQIENIQNEPFFSAQPVTGDQIVSSKDGHNNDATHNDYLLRKSRQMARNIVVTSITTQYVFTSTVFTKTLDQFAGADDKIKCLPKGFEVCKQL